MTFTKVTCATLNVRGINSPKRQYQLRRFLDQLPDIDILALQETKIESEEVTTSLINRYFLHQYVVIVSHAKGHSAGCMLLVKKSVPFEYVYHATDGDGRAIMLDCMIGNERWRVITVYAPNDCSDREEFFYSIRDYVDGSSNLLLLGDFNCTIDDEDRSSGRLGKDRSVAALRSVIENCGMLDVAEHRPGDKVRYTHFQNTSHARLDRIYVSTVETRATGNYRVIPVFFSDHCLVAITIGDRVKEHYPSASWKLWKLNVSILKDDSFCHYVFERLSKVFSSSQSWSVEWELFKLDMRQAAIEACNIRSYNNMCHERELHRQLKTFVELEAASPGSYAEEINETKLRLELFTLQKYEGARIRARRRTVLEGEVPNKRFLRLDKQQASCKRIEVLRSENQTFSDPERIRSAFEQYYRNLFGKVQTHVGDAIWEDVLSDMPSLSPEESEWLDDGIGVEEIRDAIQSLATNSSPGPDGLCAEFFKKFAIPISTVLQHVFAEAEENGVLPPSFRRSHTVLIPKKKMGVPLVTDFRPITLCNVDYKIFAKVLATRLQRVISNLVGEHQTCAIKGRSIQTNIHVVRTVLDWCREMHDQVALIQLDLAKAFDRVDHDFLFRLLVKVNLGIQFVHRIKLCYEQVATRLIINNALSKPVPLCASVRQGCPLSPLLFGLYLEPLCRKVLNCVDVRGFVLGPAEVKVLAYADDIALLLRDKTSIPKAFECIEKFCAVSGARLNKEKSLGVWGGQWGSTPTQFCGITWQTEDPTYLGVPLEMSKDPRELWTARTANIRTHAGIWKGAALSIFQRAAVCNVFLMSKLLYLLQVLPCPRKNVNIFHRIFAMLIWRSNFEAMRRSNLFKKLMDGGIGLQHIYVKQLVMRMAFFREIRHPVLEVVKRCIEYHYLPHLSAAVHSNFIRLSRYYREMVESVRFLSARFSVEYLFSVSKKKLTVDLADVLFPVPVYRQIPDEWPGKDVLCRVRRMPLKPAMKTFFFKLHTNTLPVKPWLQEKGFFVPWSVNCRFCKVPEDINHVFIHCLEAQFFWDDIQNILKLELLLNPHTIRFLPLPPGELLRLDAILLVGLFCLWKLKLADKNEEPLVPPLTLFKQEITELRVTLAKGLVTPEWIQKCCAAL